MRKGVLRNFLIFTGKHLRPATLLKKRIWHRRFPVNFVKFLRGALLQNTSVRLLLNIMENLSKVTWNKLIISSIFV